MSDRLPWFHCYPAKLLGALGAMSPDEQLVFLIVLLRIYETGGPIDDDDRALARRTGLTPRRVASARERLFALGKLVMTDQDGHYTNPVAAKEIEAAKKRIGALSENQSSRAKKGWEKAKQNQQTADAAGMPPAARGEPPAADKEGDIEEERKKESLVPSDDGTTPTLMADQVVEAKPKKPSKQDRYDRPYSPEFDRFWAAYPPRDGSRDKKEAWASFQVVTENGADPEAIISGAKQYAEAERRLNRHNTTFVKQAATWLNKRCWQDYSPQPASGSAESVKSLGIFVECDTPQWEAWKEHYKSQGKRLLYTERTPVPGERRKRGWFLPTEFPPEVPAEETKQAA
jgi:uncharacterized protein YdaU (DUF1376 family)